MRPEPHSAEAFERFCFDLEKASTDAIQSGVRIGDPNDPTNYQARSPLALNTDDDSRSFRGEAESWGITEVHAALFSNAFLTGNPGCYPNIGDAITTRYVRLGLEYRAKFYRGCLMWATESLTDETASVLSQQ